MAEPINEYAIINNNTWVATNNPGDLPTNTDITLSMAQQFNCNLIFLANKTKWDSQQNVKWVIIKALNRAVLQMYQHGFEANDIGP